MTQAGNPYDYGPSSAAITRLSGWIGLIGVPVMYIYFVLSAGTLNAAWLDPIIIIVFLFGTTLFVSVGFVTFQASRKYALPSVDEQGIRLLNPRFLSLRNSMHLDWAEISGLKIVATTELRNRGWIFWEPPLLELTIERFGGSPLEIRVVGTPGDYWLVQLQRMISKRNRAAPPPPN
jgi:hypothetical protein